MTSVDPALVAEINQLEIPCALLDSDLDTCPDPAAWLLTFTAGTQTVRPVPACISHKHALVEHQHCRSCNVRGWQITAVEL